MVDSPSQKDHILTIHIFIFYFFTKSMYQIQAYPPLFDGRRYRIERDPIVFDRDMQFSLNGTDMNIKIMVRHSFATMIDNIQHDFLKAKVT